jgi:hypothetical protein
MKLLFKKFIKKWKAETPVFWKFVRNASVAATTSITAGLLAVSTGGISLPEKTTTVLSCSLFVFGFITGYAGTREKK